MKKIKVKKDNKNVKGIEKRIGELVDDTFIFEGMSPDTEKAFRSKLIKESVKDTLKKNNIVVEE